MASEAKDVSVATRQAIAVIHARDDIILLLCLFS